MSKMEQPVEKTVFILEQKYKIEDYYMAESIIGIFSSVKKAEEAISMLETKYQAKLLDRYFKYKFSTQDRAIKSASEMIETNSEALKRKVPGSNGYAKILNNLNYAQAKLEEAKNFVPDAYEIWLGYQAKFVREDFIISEMPFDTLQNNHGDIL